MTQELTVKIGGNMNADDKKLFRSSTFAKKHPKRVLYLNSFEELHQLLTPSRLKLLRFLSDTREQKPTVSGIAAKTQRKQSAISRDLAKLKNARLVELHREKRFVYPKTACQKIVIEITNR